MGDKMHESREEFRDGSQWSIRSCEDTLSVIVTKYDRSTYLFVSPEQARRLATALTIAADHNDENNENGRPTV